MLLARNPTLMDVARRAGVSTATVSRCLNTPATVREETRERVLAVVDALGYTPHFAGRALASKRTHTIGAVIPTMENAIFARALQSVEEVLAGAGATLLVASSGYDPQREEAQIGALLRRGVDGILLIGRARPKSSYDLLRRHGTPFVLTWTLGRRGSPPCVGFDNRAAAHALTERVVDLGHRDIAMIGGETAWNDRAGARIDGVRDGLAARGLELRADRLIEAPYTLEAGADAFRRLAGGERIPTVVICGNDVLAAGALKAARALSLSVPGDVSITGFDDIDLAEAVDPGLTTVHVPHRRMGSAAANTLLALRDGEKTDAHTRFETWIVERDSLAPPRG